MGLATPPNIRKLQRTLCAEGQARAELPVLRCMTRCVGGMSWPMPTP